MRQNQVAVVGAAETTELGVIPTMSQIQLHADAALNAIANAGLKLSDIDGFATAVETPQQICHYLGITPTWVDGTSVGGCSFMLHVRHAAAAIDSAGQPAGPVRGAVRRLRATQHVPDPRAALHEDLRHYP